MGAAAGVTPMKESFGVEAEVWDSTAVHERVPAALPGVVGGVFTAEDGHVEPVQAHARTGPAGRGTGRHRAHRHRGDRVQPRPPPDHGRR